jgi:hypothetical protein
MIIDDLFAIHQTYTNFMYEWGRFKESILKSINTNESPDYRLLESKDADHEVRFLFCGISCYVRFRYDLKRGGAEYGVLVADPMGDHLQRKAIHQVDLMEFDQDSRRLYEGHAMIVHEKALARLFPQMLATFFGDSSKNS